MTVTRCSWANPANPRYLAYHDTEWGVPCHDERTLFEMLNLEGAQAGLSWETILNKRDTYRAAFDGWDAQKIAAYGPEKVASLLADPGIVRNRLKVAAAITNAQAYLRLRAEGQTLDGLLWAYVGGQPIVNHWTDYRDTPSQTAESVALSKALKKAGFRFVGATTCYAFMQAVGMVDDHQADCFRAVQASSL